MRESDDLWEDLERGQARYVILRRATSRKGYSSQATPLIDPPNHGGSNHHGLESAKLDHGWW